MERYPLFWTHLTEGGTEEFQVIEEGFPKHPFLQIKNWAARITPNSTKKRGEIQSEAMERMRLMISLSWNMAPPGGMPHFASWTNVQYFILAETLEEH
ncbi:MAG: hypothetical protein Q8O19_03515 [Rectinemataceae bacterium]|nr:hypothetical protein [Rectinemataceae bacterium]